MGEVGREDGCRRRHVTHKLGACRYLEVFMGRVGTADQAVPRSPNVIEQAHMLLQRATKRMEKMELRWGDFTSWQAVSELVRSPPP